MPANLHETCGPARGLGLFSGGLDSMLAAAFLARLGHPVELITFETPFFSADRARQSARQVGLPLLVMDVSEEHLALVKDPPHGYGNNMNPCIDCHAFMFNKAGGVMEERGFDFIFSGEVLNQRPMSQNLRSLSTVAKDSGYADFILRPLSARRLPPTRLEKDGVINREEMGELSGRSRKPQMAMAEEFGISEYPSPAGGCSLTEPGFSRRLSDLFAHSPLATVAEVNLLKAGRHLRLSPRAKLVVGSNQADNAAILAMVPPGAISITRQGVPGPVALYLGPAEGPELEQAAAIAVGYGKADPDQEVEVALSDGRVLSVAPLSKREAHHLIL